MSNRIPDEVVRQVFEAEGEQQEIAERFGISKASVLRIKKGHGSGLVRQLYMEQGRRVREELERKARRQRHQSTMQSPELRVDRRTK